MPYSPAHLIPRRKLFGNPYRAMTRISPDGSQLAWLQPLDGVLNVWVAPLADLPAARAITKDAKRGIRFYMWSATGSHILYMQDREGAEDWHVHSVRLAGGDEIDLTPLSEIHAQPLGISQELPHLLAVSINDRDKAWHDIYHVDIRDGRRELIYRNDEELGSFRVDRRLRLRLATKELPGGGASIRRHTPEGFEPFLEIGSEDALGTSMLGFTLDGRRSYMLSTVGRDKAALYAVDWPEARQTLIAEHGKADIGGILTNPVTHVIEGYSVEHLREEQHAVGNAIASDLKRLEDAFSGDYSVSSRSLDSRLWIVVESSPQSPGVAHLYERATGKLTRLHAARPDLEGEPLRPMRPMIVPSRDGLELVSYLTLPEGAPEGRPVKSLPLVLNVHGGPWARDAYGYDPEHQWLADRGYAVLSVNFRSSTGFGKGFVNAGNLEWGRRMHDDLIDAVDRMVADGIADPARIAIMGGSYGGYAALAGLTFTPEVFACAIDIVGPSNLATLLATVPPYWKAFFENLALRVGDPRTEEGRALLAERSPLTHVARIARPLLIGQGANDPRVKQAESDQIVAAMQAKGLPVTYALYPDEGHGFARPENRISFYAVAEAFLAQHLGGRFEPIGSDLEGASLKVPAGAAGVPGLREALAARGGKVT